MASGTDTSIEINSISPGAIQAGDLCIIWNKSTGAGAPSSPPSGFTSIVSHSETAGEGIISAKILTGSETTVTGLDRTAESWICAVFRPTGGTLVSFASNDTASDNQGGNPGSQTINAAGETNLPILLVGQMAVNTAGSVNPRSISPSMDELTVANHHYSHYKIYNEGDTPADHTYDMDDEGTVNILQSAYLDFVWA